MRRTPPHLSRRFLVGLAVGLLLASHSAYALPPGRTWAPSTEMAVQGSSDYLNSPLLDRGSTGIPYLTMGVRWDSLPRHTWTSFTWRDSAWSATDTSSERAGYPQVLSVGQGLSRAMGDVTYWDNATREFWLVLLEIGPGSIGPADTVLQTTSTAAECAFASRGRRRWAVRSEQPISATHVVRTFYSDTAHIWREVEQLGNDDDHCTVAPLGDTTAMVVYAGGSGLEYALLDGSRWIEKGNLDPRPFNAANPRLRLRPSGGLWLIWADYGWVHISSYRNGVWSRGDSLRCVPNPGETFRPIFLDAENDTTEYPVFAWTNSGYGDTWRDVTAIAIPGEDGWHGAEEVPESEQSGWIPPTVTRDLNGDTWVAWRRARFGVNRWTHTYCSATCAAPSVTPLGDGTRLTWTLSSRAPRSRWSVWRAAGDGAPFDSLGTVRAGEDSLLAFDDTTAGPGQTWRYRIRRESVDIRYRWESDVATHWRPDTRVPIGLALANPTGNPLTFRLTGAAGLLWATLYDLQGRIVLRERLAAKGTGKDSFTLDLGTSGARRPGIYFLRVSDGTRRTTRTARVAVVR